MLRVTVVVPVFPKLSETFIVSKVVGLIDRGFDVRVLVQKFDGQAWARFPALATRADIKRRIIEASSSTGVRFAVASAWRLARLVTTHPVLLQRYVRNGYRSIGPRVFRRLIRDLGILGTKPDLVHFEFGALSVNRAEIGQWIGCKVITSFRGYDLNYAGLETPGYYEDVWKAVDAVHCLGEDLWARAQRRGCPPDKPHVLIPPCIDGQFFTPSPRDDGGRLGTAERELRILSVGRLEWKKGHEYALSALRILRDRGVHARLTIVGNGEYLEAVMFCRRQLGLDDWVEVLGGVSQTEVRDLMQDSDVFLHAAVSEGFCNAVLEAQAMGLAVVTSDADGLGENVVDGRTGYVVERRNPTALAEKLEHLAGDGNLRADMGAEGRKRVLSQFRIEDQIEAFGRLYASVGKMQ